MGIEKTTCEDVQPEGSKLVGEGKARCVFEKDGNIIKEPTSYLGVKQSEGARAVKENVEEHTDKFAMPKKVVDGTVIQEKVTPFKETVSDDRFQDLKDKTLDIITLNEGNERSKMKQNIREVTNDEGVYCSDIRKPSNWGIKDDKLVLVDLGECSFDQKVIE